MQPTAYKIQTRTHIIRTHQCFFRNTDPFTP